MKLLERYIGWRLDRQQARYPKCSVCVCRPCEQVGQWENTWLGKRAPLWVAALVPMFMLHRLRKVVRGDD